MASGSTVLRQERREEHKAGKPAPLILPESRVAKESEEGVGNQMRTSGPAPGTPPLQLDPPPVSAAPTALSNAELFSDLIHGEVRAPGSLKAPPVNPGDIGRECGSTPECALCTHSTCTHIPKMCTQDTAHTHAGYTHTGTHQTQMVRERTHASSLFPGSDCLWYSLYDLSP